MSTNPSFVFSYLPSAPKATTTAPTAEPSFYEQTTSFLQAARRAFANPKLTTQQQEIAILQQAKQHLEEDVAFKAKAGVSVGVAEKQQMMAVTNALSSLDGLKK